MKRILDIGCGTGDLIRSLHDERKNCDFYGIDPSSENIKMCMVILEKARFY